LEVPVSVLSLDKDGTVQAVYDSKDDVPAALKDPLVYPDNNPKSVVGVTKPPLHLIPPVASLHEAMAFAYGAFHAGPKGTGYGPFNWRESSVAASVYYSAMLRHLFDWWDRQDHASDSGAHHLGHLRAGAAIVLDAIELGRLIDDRPPAGKSAEVIDRLTRKI
jgi:hypothetical protein